MKMKIYLDVEGQEALANGKELWAWHYTVRTVNQHETPPKGGILLGEFEVELPVAEACIPQVLEVLKQREQEINAQAHEDLTAIRERRDNLLALTFEGTVS